MASPLAHTVGIWLIAIFLQAMLHGMGLLQTFLYFVWYHKDNWTIKGTVIVMIVIESVQMGAAFSNVYTWLIDGFGDFENLGIIHWQDMVQLTALYLSTFVAQAHFTRCIYQVQREYVVLPALILLLSLTALGGGTGQVILVIRVGEYSKLGQTSATTNLQAAFALASDTLITFGLCWRLNKSRTGIQSTNNVLNFLIMTAINRGVFTMFFAALNVILFVSQPGTFYFMLALLLSDKFYMNSMLAMLNTRQQAIRMHRSTVVEQISMPIFASNAQSVQDSIIVQSGTATEGEARLENLTITNRKFAI
ncbi:hypothetical protein B0H10DRAFT_2197354 [Mycena sp. CBHHK59/15]|nr:hypothetical protein B0H10DRAFT_2197354 [Mycena sp. CBHHK59/15]